MTFLELSEQWYKRKTTASTYKYNKELENRITHLNRFIGHMDVKNIKWIHLEDGLIDLARYNPHTKKQSSQKLVNNILNTAVAIMMYAYDLELISRNPFFNHKAPKAAKINPRRALTTTEQELILHTTHRMKVGALIMMLCGLRKGELIALNWDDIDFKKKSIKVVKSASLIATNKYEIKAGTKNSKSRIVPIPDIILPTLSEAKTNATSTFVTTAANGQLHTPSTWVATWNSYYNKLNYAAYHGDKDYYHPKGIPRVINKITPHMLRHTYATLLYDAGVDVLTAQKLLGHANVTTTLSIYTHLDDTKKLYSISEFNNYLKENF